MKFDDTMTCSLNFEPWFWSLSNAKLTSELDNSRACAAEAAEAVEVAATCLHCLPNIGLMSKPTTEIDLSGQGPWYIEFALPFTSAALQVWPGTNTAHRPFA